MNKSIKFAQTYCTCSHQALLWDDVGPYCHHCGGFPMLQMDGEENHCTCDTPFIVSGQNGTLCRRCNKTPESPVHGRQDVDKLRQENRDPYSQATHAVQGL